uniref:F-box/WD repeat-containing protein 8-like n=1 Tax=Geotrypetes seraphini TaxID=260995 RepID=A0A6P8S3S6_GEOSA|nr:F-box/WD repeat-containing protein 8-like [Geotrypetes seraphini]
MAGEGPLEEFRRQWRAELSASAAGSSGQRRGRAKRKRREAELAGDGSPRDPRGYFELAEGLLQGRGLSWERGRGSPATAKAAAPSLVEQLISDLNEINEIPFFDIQLPYELALQIFQYLNRVELGRCAQMPLLWMEPARSSLTCWLLGEAVRQGRLLRISEWMILKMFASLLSSGAHCGE